MIRKCTKCFEFKPKSEFYKESDGKDGLRGQCKQCDKNRAKVYFNNNIGLIKEKRKVQRKHSNRLVPLPYKIRRFASKEAWKVKINKRLRDRRVVDSLYKLSRILRGRAYTAFQSKKWRKNSKSEELLGADFLTIRKYIESKFKKGMSWENQGEWHIDHIIPLSSAKNEEDLIVLCHYRNLQPLWKKDNLSKGDKIPSFQAFLRI